jgi:hypothetical protein
MFRLMTTFTFCFMMVRPRPGEIPERDLAITSLGRAQGVIPFCQVVTKDVFKILRNIS